MRYRHQPPNHERRLQHLFRRDHARAGNPNVRPHSATLVQEDPTRRHLQPWHLRNSRRSLEQVLLIHCPLRRRLGVLVRPRKRHSHYRRQPPIRLAAVPPNVRHPNHQRHRKQEQKQERRRFRDLTPLQTGVQNAFTTSASATSRSAAWPTRWRRPGSSRC